MKSLKSLFTNSNEKEQKIQDTLAASRKSFLSKLNVFVQGKSKIDASVLDELEEILLSADVGVKTTIKIIDAIEERVAKDKFLNANDIKIIIKEEILKILTPSLANSQNNKTEKNPVPFVILIVGVNGVGKTTTIGKLSEKYRKNGKKVIIGAADTFRAGAINQLEKWATRTDAKLVKQKMGSDPASITFDTLTAAVSQSYDVAIIDTAGRLHNKVNLMNELTKIKKVMHRVIPNAPHDIMLIIDGSTGQNAIEQTKQFTLATEISSLAVTKLDGTAKGGVVLGIVDQFNIPIKYIGTGEGIEDLVDFQPENFIHSLFN